MFDKQLSEVKQIISKIKIKVSVLKKQLVDENFVIGSALDI